jgi:hypothetical protein
MDPLFFQDGFAQAFTTGQSGYITLMVFAVMF